MTVYGITEEQVKLPVGYSKEAEDKYLNDMRAFIKSESNSPHNGKIVRFQVADSYAEYMVITPTKLVHLEIGDAWQFQYINNLKGKDILEKIRQSEAMAELFKN